MATMPLKEVDNVEVLTILATTIDMLWPDTDREHSQWQLYRLHKKSPN